MKDAFGVSKTYKRKILKEVTTNGVTYGYSRSKKKSKVSKIVVRTPTRLVRWMSDRYPRPADGIDRLERQMNGPHGFDNPVSVGFTRKHNMTSDHRAKAKKMGLKTETPLPTPKLVNGHHRLGLAERKGQKSMLVDWHLRPKHEGNYVVQRDGEWVDGPPPGGIPKDRTKEVAAGAAAVTAGGVGGSAFLVHRHNKKKRVSKSFPRYGMIKNMPGKRRILKIEGDMVHFEEEGVASRTAHRSRVTFLKDKPLAQPKWTQGTLFPKKP
jgi:hypothetical protein